MGYCVRLVDFLLTKNRGQERFRAISAAYYRGANGALIVYDITNQETFNNLNKWFKEIENQGENGCLNVLVGNKCDLEHLRQVQTDDGRNFAEKHNVSFMETSALDNTNVDTAFTSLLKEIYKNQKKGKKANNNEGVGQINEGVSSGTKISLNDAPKTEEGGAQPAKGCAC